MTVVFPPNIPGTTTGTLAAGDDARFTLFPEQAAMTTTPRTLNTSDAGTQLPVNVASGVVTCPTYSASFLGFAMDLYAVQAFTLNGTSSGTVAAAAGDFIHLRAIGGAWKAFRSSPTAALV